MAVLAEVAGYGEDAMASRMNVFLASLLTLRTVFAVAVIALSPGTSRGSDGSEDSSLIAIPSEVHEILGEGVVYQSAPDRRSGSKPANSTTTERDST
jgi:hypothetical protein